MDGKKRIRAVLKTGFVRYKPSGYAEIQYFPLLLSISQLKPG